MAYTCTYCQQTGHMGLNCSLRHESGQVWRLSKPKGVDVTVEVVIYKTRKSGPNTVKYFDAKCLKSDHPLYIRDTIYGFNPQQFVSIWSSCNHSNVKTQKPIQPAIGAQCVKCKKDYPYADAGVDFTCWSCNNGY
jgi:hypothetical protein